MNPFSLYIPAFNIPYVCGHQRNERADLRILRRKVHFGMSRSPFHPSLRQFRALPPFAQSNDGSVQLVIRAYDLFIRSHPNRNSQIIIVSKCEMNSNSEWNEHQQNAYLSSLNTVYWCFEQRHSRLQNSHFVAALNPQYPAFLHSEHFCSPWAFFWIWSKLVYQKV